MARTHTLALALAPPLFRKRCEWEAVWHDNDVRQPLSLFLLCCQRRAVTVSWVRARERVGALGFHWVVAAAFWLCRRHIAVVVWVCEGDGNSSAGEQALSHIDGIYRYVSPSPYFLRGPGHHRNFVVVSFCFCLNLLWRINQIFTFRNWRLESAVAKNSPFVLPRRLPSESVWCEPQCLCVCRI